jgi:hypothetical protein
MSENGSNAIVSVGDLASSFFNGLGNGSISSAQIQTSPEFFGNVKLPITTSIGPITGTEIGFLTGLRNNIQYQFDNLVYYGTTIFGPGTTSAAPLKILAGTNTITPSPGNIEFDGTSLYYTNNNPTPARQTLATTTYVDSIIDGAPGVLNTLNELAFALNDDANYATTITTALSGKEPAITAGTTAQYWRGDKTWQTLNKASVDLSNVTNESKATMFSNPTFSGTTTLPAGTTTVAPLKLTAGTNLTSPVAGSVEFDGTEIYITNSVGSRKTLTYTDHTHTTATISVAGFMSAADKVRLDGIAAGAEVNVQADWNASSGDAAILNKPDNATISVAGFMSATDKSRLDDASGVNGLVKCNGSGDFSVASAGTDYAATSHTHGSITNDGKLGTTTNLPLITTTGGTISTGSFGTAANTFCAGNDTRLSDARTPASHTHGSITNDGKLGTTTNLPLITTTGGTISTGSFGTTANTFCAGNDTRIDNLHTVVNTSAATLTITEADNNEYIRCSAAGGTAITLNGAGAWTDGMTVTVRRVGGTSPAGALTLTTSNATINDNDIANILAGDTFALKCVDISSPTNKVFDFI